MNVHLLFAGRDPAPAPELPPNSADLIQDLGVDTLLEAMACGDRFLYEVAMQMLLTSLTDPVEITYRQRILRDFLARPRVLRELYELSVEAVTGQKKLFWSMLGYSPSGLLYRSVRAMEFLVDILRRLRHLAEQHTGEVASEGLTNLFAMLVRELDEPFFAEATEHLKLLRFHGGVPISATLGTGGGSTNYVLRQPPHRGWLARLVPPNRRGQLLSVMRGSYTLRIADRDQAGADALASLRDRGLHLVADALSQSTQHVTDFFKALRRELGFYVGCLNLHEQLAGNGQPTCFPTPAADAAALSAQGLYDPGLSLRIRGQVVGNDLAADGRPLVVVTGANQGGKSTFLRSVGLAQLMMQSGMFSPANSYRARVGTCLFTHYKREEDDTMEHGKLDEELARMSQIVALLRPGGMMLLNESFASTNEGEGSQIAHDIVQALLSSGITVCYVTHMFHLAQWLQHDVADRARFLRAQRRQDGSRTFQLVEGAPLPTSYGTDLYRSIFGSGGDDRSAAAPG